MNFALDIALPIAGLVGLAIALPFLAALIVPEGLPGLAVNFALSALVLSVAVFAYFITWHVGRSDGLTPELLKNPSAMLPYYLGWAGKTSLFWLPVLVLSVAAQPRRWKDVVW